MKINSPLHKRLILRPVVNPAALLPLSGQIESEHTHELTTVDLEAVLDPGSSLPSLCDSDDVIDMEMDGQTEVENTQVKGQDF